MKLLRLEAENIFSLGKVDVDLENRGLILITGYSEDEGSSNGAGKSSISTKAILWTLFGQIPEDMKADEVVNRHAEEKTGHGKLLFYDKEGRFCTVHRKRGKTNRLRFLVEEQDLTCRNQKETQELINQSIGRDFNTFIQSDFFGQGREMSYAALTPKQQKEILEQILPMEACDQWAEYAKQQYKEVDELVGRKERELHTTTVKLTTLRTQHEMLLNRSVTWQQEHDKKLKEKQDALDAENGRIECIKINIADLNKELEQYPLLEDPEGLAREREDLRGLREITDENSVAKQFNIARDRVSQWEQVASQYKNELGLLETKQGRNECPECGQIIADDVQNYTDKRVSELHACLTEAARNIEAAREAWVYWQGEDEKILNKINELNRALDMHAAHIGKRRSIEDKINVYMSKIGSQTEVLKAQIEELNKDANPFSIEVEKLSKEVSKLEKEEKAQKKSLKRFEREREDLLFWHNMYGKDLKLRIFEAACPFLDARTAHYLTALGNDQIHVEFSTVKRLASGDAKEEFSVRAWSDTGGASYGSLSGGEKKITSFAIGLALADLAASQTSGNTDFLILDEPFEQLDERNSEAIVHYLKDGCGKSTVLLISNEDHLKQLVPNRIHVVKRRGVSNIGSG